MDTALFSTTSRLCSKHVVIRLSIALSILLACGLLIQNSLPYPLPFSLWGKVLWSPNMESYQQVILHYSFFPRLIMALICGAGLALAGCVMQAVLRNPLASPTTLGVASGAQLGIAIALLLPLQDWASLHSIFFWLTPQWFAFVGGLFATGLVFLLTAKKRFCTTTNGASGYGGDVIFWLVKYGIDLV